MGNFSVNHYARLEPGSKGLTVTYVLDLAELPTTELIQSWGVDRNSPRPVMEAQAAIEARRWAANLNVTENGKRMLGIMESSQLAVEDGAANLPLYRITARVRFLAKGGRIEYEDGNYATRAGWREIVVRAGEGAALTSASNGSEERSLALTSYPKDQEKSPPQDSKAWLEWRMTAPPTDARPVMPSVTPSVTTSVAPVVAQRQAEAPAPQPAPQPQQDADPEHAGRTVGIVIGLIAVLFLARWLTRARRPVA